MLPNLFDELYGVALVLGVGGVVTLITVLVLIGAYWAVEQLEANETKKEKEHS